MACRLAYGMACVMSGGLMGGVVCRGGLGGPRLAVAPHSLASLIGLVAEAGKCARRRTYFLCPAKESKQRKAAPRQRPCTTLRFATFRANLRGREPVPRLGASGKNSGLGWAARRSAAARLWPCKGEQRRRPPKALFCSRARAAGRLTTTAARQNSLCDLRSRRSDNCREREARCKHMLRCNGSAAVIALAGAASRGG